jgi:hypothetical protein
MLDRGDRSTLQVTLTREGTDPAPSVQMSWGGAWETVEPVDADDTPAVYEKTFAYGDEADFPDANGGDVAVISGSVHVRVRPLSGSPLNTQDVAFIVTKG